MSSNATLAQNASFLAPAPISPISMKIWFGAISIFSLGGCLLMLLLIATIASSRQFRSGAGWLIIHQQVLDFGFCICNYLDSTNTFAVFFGQKIHVDCS